MRVIAWLAATFTAVSAATYTVVSLNRWEWNRALFFGILFLIAEVAMVGGLILQKLTRLGENHSARDMHVADVVRATRPDRANRFAWLEESVTQQHVFIMFLVGGGVVLSGVAWVVDRVAGATITPDRERRLTEDLTEIAYPRGGLLVDDTTVLAQEVPGADDVQIRHLLRRAGESL
ncbi:MAG TPA: hypothetical protein VFN21_10565 [Acidimicrobiales bacterium]|nr:hypothetical protein [Acidimicrobiales bacterium]